MRYPGYARSTNVTCPFLVGLIFVAVGASAQSNNATLLFKSGFENNTTLGPVTGNAPNSIEQTLSGMDHSTGFSWPLMIFDPNPDLTGIHLIPPSSTSDALSDHFFNAIQTVTGHSGTLTQVLLLKIDGYPNASCCAQEPLETVGMSQSITSMYQRIWIKLQPDFAAQVQAYRNDFWRVMWEFKTTTDYRTAAYIYGDADGNAYWHVHADDDVVTPTPTTYWSIDNHSVPVPLNQWFLMEIYLNRSTGSSGRFFWAVNGQTIADYTGPNYGANNEPIREMFYQNLYGNYFPMYQWVDDFEVWNRPPCANLPCGAPLGAVRLSSLSCNPTSLAANATSICTVTLSQSAPASGVVVTLSSNNGLLDVPATVTIASGSTSSTFTAGTGTIEGNGTATVTATYNGISQQASFSLTATVAVVLSSLSCTLTTLGAGASSSCSVALSQEAPTAGAIVYLMSNSTLLTVPASVVVAPGTTSQTFSATARTVNINQTVILTAVYNSSLQKVAISLVAQPVVSSLSCMPTELTGGGTSTCVVNLSAAAPKGGAAVSLLSSNPLLTLPATVTIAVGAMSGTFTATAGNILRSQMATVTAIFDSSSQSTRLSLAGQTVLSSMGCLVATLTSGAATNCFVVLSAVAPAGTLITLSSSTSSLIVPASVNIQPGSLTSTFPASASVVNVSQNAVITATLNGTTKTASLALLPPETVVTPSTGNSLVNGMYFVRQVSLGIDGSGQLTDARSVIGTINFDGAGNYSFAGKSALNGTALPQTANGTYAADTAGMVSIDSLVRSGERVNARFSSEAIVGSTTESANNTFDLFIAIPAPTALTNNGSLTGSYGAATLEFPGGSFANVRNSFIALNSAGDGTFQSLGVTGHAADHASGQLVTEQLSGATYTISNNGTGSVNLGSASSVVSGTKTISLSQDGNVVLGGTADSYDVLIGIRAPTQPVMSSSWAGPFWGAGLRLDATGLRSFAGSAVASGSGSLYWTRRLKVSGFPNVDLTEVDPYSLLGGGSGTSRLTHVTLGAAGNLFLGTSVNSSDANGYEIYLGTRMPTANGGGLYLNPQGVQNVASYAPTGNPITPGELIYLYVSGLTVIPQTATQPYPLSLNGVSVLINGNLAPLYLVSTTQLVAVVPYATTGPTASIVVQANGVTSNTVVVPVAATAPGVFSQLKNGNGLGAIRHADYGVVTAANPAHSGEVVLIYLTGLGSVTPPLADGVGGSANPLSVTTVNPTVMVGSSPAQVLFSGMSAYPGLYQINAKLPTIPAGSSTLPVVITTPNAFHDQVDIAVTP